MKPSLLLPCISFNVDQPLRCIRVIIMQNTSDAGLLKIEQAWEQIILPDQSVLGVLLSAGE